jgi:hypothetical protein
MDANPNVITSSFPIYAFSYIHGAGVCGCPRAGGRDLVPLFTFEATVEEYHSLRLQFIVHRRAVSAAMYEIRRCSAK